MTSIPDPIATVVTKRDDAITSQTVAATPSADTPNVILKPMQPLAIIAVRAARVYLQALVGLLTAGTTGLDAGILPNDLVALLSTCAQLAIAPAVMSALTNATELLARIDESFPRWRA